MGVFSFNGNKMITGTTGGMLVTRGAEGAAKARHCSTQARDPDPEGTNNYVHTEAGYNYRMSNVVAGIVRGQLEVLEDRVHRRRKVFEGYRSALAGLPGLNPQPEGACATDGESGELGTCHGRYSSGFLVDGARFGMSPVVLIRWLDKMSVEARHVWKPMHTQPLFQGYDVVGGEVAEDLNRRVICLPSSSSLSEEDQGYVIEAILAAGSRKA